MAFCPSAQGQTAQVHKGDQAVIMEAIGSHAMSQLVGTDHIAGQGLLVLNGKEG